jgi:hypothetical protein
MNIRSLGYLSEARVTRKGNFLINSLTDSGPLTLVFHIPYHHASDDSGYTSSQRAEKGPPNFERACGKALKNGAILGKWGRWGHWGEMRERTTERERSGKK